MIREFNLDIYPRTLWVTYDATPKELSELFPTDSDGNVINWLPEIPGYGAEMEVFSKPGEKGGVLIRFENWEAMTPGHIAHEAVHAADDIYYFIGAHPDILNNEPYAYLVGYITDCCEKAKYIKDECTRNSELLQDAPLCC